MIDWFAEEYASAPGKMQADLDDSYRQNPIYKDISHDKNDIEIPIIICADCGHVMQTHRNPNGWVVAGCEMCDLNEAGF